MDNKIYRLVNKKRNKVVFQGSYEECKKREIDSLEYVGVITPRYRATNDNGFKYEGTVKEISAALGEKTITLYNYTRFKRKNDGLFLEKIEG